MEHNSTGALVIVAGMSPAYPPTSGGLTGLARSDRRDSVFEMQSRVRAILYASPLVAYATMAAVYGAAHARASRTYAARFAALADLGDRTYAAMHESRRGGAFPALGTACSGWLVRGAPESLAAYIAGRSSQGEAQLSWAAVPGTLVGASHAVGIVREQRRDVNARGFFSAWWGMLTTWPGRWSERVRTSNLLEPSTDHVHYLAVVSVDIALAPHEASVDTFASGEALLMVRVMNTISGNQMCEGQVLTTMPERVRVDAAGATRAEAVGNLLMGASSALTRAYSNSIELAPLRVLCGDVNYALCEMVTAAGR